MHAILEESLSKDNLSSSEEESSGSPILRMCNTMIPVTPPPPHNYTTVGGDPDVSDCTDEAVADHYTNTSP
jgi:hypothetical protein